MFVSEEQKTAADREEEAELLAQLLSVVEQRDMLVEETESDRIKYVVNDIIP